MNFIPLHRYSGHIVIDLEQNGVTLTDEVHVWLCQMGIKYALWIHEEYLHVCIEDKENAMLFKLTWGGETLPSVLHIPKEPNSNTKITKKPNAAGNGGRGWNGWGICFTYDSDKHWNFVETDSSDSADGLFFMEKCKELFGPPCHDPNSKRRRWTYIWGGSYIYVHFMSDRDAMTYLFALHSS